MPNVTRMSGAEKPRLLDAVVRNEASHSLQLQIPFGEVVTVALFAQDVAPKVH